MDSRGDFSDRRRTGRPAHVSPAAIFEHQQASSRGCPDTPRPYRDLRNTPVHALNRQAVQRVPVDDGTGGIDGSEGVCRQHPHNAVRTRPEQGSLVQFQTCRPNLSPTGAAEAPDAASRSPECPIVRDGEGIDLIGSAFLDGFCFDRLPICAVEVCEVAVRIERPNAGAACGDYRWPPSVECIGPEAPVLSIELRDTARGRCPHLISD